MSCSRAENKWFWWAFVASILTGKVYIIYGSARLLEPSLVSQFPEKGSKGGIGDPRAKTFLLLAI